MLWQWVGYSQGSQASCKPPVPIRVPGGINGVIAFKPGSLSGGLISNAKCGIVAVFVLQDDTARSTAISPVTVAVLGRALPRRSNPGGSKPSRSP